MAKELKPGVHDVPVLALKSLCWQVLATGNGRKLPALLSRAEAVDQPPLQVAHRSHDMFLQTRPTLCPHVVKRPRVEEDSVNRLCRLRYSVGGSACGA